MAPKLAFQLAKYSPRILGLGMCYGLYIGKSFLISLKFSLGCTLTITQEYFHVSFKLML